MSTTNPPAPRERPILFRDEMVRAILGVWVVTFERVEALR